VNNQIRKRPIKTKLGTTQYKEFNTTGLTAEFCHSHSGSRFVPKLTAAHVRINIFK